MNDFKNTKIKAGSHKARIWLASVIGALLSAIGVAAILPERSHSLLIWIIGFALCIGLHFIFDMLHAYMEHIKTMEAIEDGLNQKINKVRTRIIGQKETDDDITE